METAQLESKVYAALTGDEILTGLLADGGESVFHLQAPADDYPRSPIIVYSPISDVPVLHGDNAEELHRVIIRIHVITDDGEYEEIYQAIKRLMLGLGFTRHQTTVIVGRGKKMLAADFKIVTGG